MDFFINSAWAQAAPAQQPDPFTSFIPLILIFVVFYFLLIRPQSKRAKEHRKMVSELKAGDEVVTAGGLLGRVSHVGEQFLKVEVAEGTELKVQRQNVTAVVPKGTFKSV